MPKILLENITMYKQMSGRKDRLQQFVDVDIK